MQKFPIFLAFFLCFLLLAKASIHTVLDDDTDNPGTRETQSCHDQMEMHGMLNHCASYVMDSCVSGGRRGRGGRTSIDYNEQHLRQCCMQLGMMEERCRCDGLEMMMEERMRTQLQGQQMRKAMRCVQDIPMMCNMRPMHCEFGRMFYK